MKKYFFLMRLDRPIGFMLLFWPCAWGFAIISSQRPMDRNWLAYLILFFVGSILMRSAGCVYNDIIDQKIDQKVKRTKFRQIASGKVSICIAWVLTIFLSLLSLLILFQFNLKAIIFGLSSGILIALYPFMKRITYWPQLFLGIVFNWGVILSYLVFNDQISLEIILIYISAILWTLGYDTIYGLQDIYDDIRIGVKSTSIKFKKNIKQFLTIVYILSFSLIFIVSILITKKIGIFFIFYLLPLFLLAYQIQSVEIRKNKKNLSLFKLNNYYGLSIFLIQIFIFKYA
jgi:4-hydroxybenzoate polyprenyltransferase